MQKIDLNAIDPIRLFGDYMKITGVPALADEPGDDPALRGKKLGIVNGSNWVSLWSTWFGRKHCPGVKLVQLGNEGVQLNFMAAHAAGQPVPPRINIDLFGRYARDLFDLVKVDAVLISCSTMNRAFAQVAETMSPLGVPVVQIDEAMMEQAVAARGHILVIATHGPTVKNTQSLLTETAGRMGLPVDFSGATIEEAFHLLGSGDIAAHNESIAGVIRREIGQRKVDVVVLAQLSMSVFGFSYPDPVSVFGVPVLCSGDTGFQRVAQILRATACSR